MILNAILAPIKLGSQMVVTANHLENTDGNREVWIDGLRLLAGLSMVGLHASADAYGQPFPNASAEARALPMLLRSVLYIARTELFLLISVFLLLMAVQARPRSYGATLRQLMGRLLPPFLFWTVFYLFYSLLKAQAFGYFPTALIQLQSAEYLARSLVLGGAKYHMHFIPTLVGLLLFFPLFKIAYKYPFLGFSLVAFLALRRELDAALYQFFWQADLLPYLLRGAKILSYIGYGMAAAALLALFHRYTPMERARWSRLLGALLLGLFGFKLAATVQVIETGRWAYTNIPGYWADFLMPVLLMGLFLSLSGRSWPAVLSRGARYSFGIYLCHPIFLDLAEIALHRTDLSPINLVITKIAFTAPSTFLFVLCLGKIRSVAWTVGLGKAPQFRFLRLKKSHTQEANHAHQH